MDLNVWLYLYLSSLVLITYSAPPLVVWCENTMTEPSVVLTLTSAPTLILLCPKGNLTQIEDT